MKVKIVLTLAALCLLAGCGQTADSLGEVIEYEDVNTYDKTVVSLTPVALDEVLMMPRKLWVQDSTLIVYDEGRSENGVLRGYDLPSGQLSFHDILIGNGPAEYLLPQFMEIGDHLLAYSVTGRSELLSVDENENGKKLSRVEQQALSDEQLYFSNYLFPVNDTLVVANQGGESQFTVYNPQTDSIWYFNNFPKKYSVSDFVLNTAVFDAFYVMGENRRIVVAYKYYPIVDVVDPLNRFATQRIVFNNQFQNQFKVIDEANVEFIDPKWQYTFTHCNSRYFYALYQNSDRETLRDNRQTSEIHQFSWDGTFVGRWVTDRPLYNFTVSADDKYLYGLSFDEESEPIVLRGAL
ncbi:MAG: TolB-like 6-bladed beta-propeller domain-containing protein [Rikenellaceae bacterium]|jgi:hypothetical protein|nr:TolB-like 6-bladed beta-propeller domain-containing protein [Rikenellaceae bacterium]